MALATTLRRRIVGHRRVAAGALRPHPLNPHAHGEVQRAVLRGLLEEIGLARSVLAYVADADRARGEAAPLTLIDGHLRREELRDQEVDVEVLDVSDAEANALLLALDPLVGLARFDADKLQELRDLVRPESAAVTALWQELDASVSSIQRVFEEAEEAGGGAGIGPERFLVVVECADAEQQRELLERFTTEGLKCRARAG